MFFRRLYKGTYGPLLALCALVGVLWAGSYRSIARARLAVVADATRWEITSYRGMLSIALIDNFPTDAPGEFTVRGDNEAVAAAADERYWTAAIAGIGFEDAQIWRPDAEGALVVRRWTALSLPYWLLLSVALLGPAHAACIAFRACRRTAHNQCGECGYDLGDGEICQACVARAALIGASSRMQLVR